MARAGRLDADQLGLWRELLDHQRDAGHQPAAADGGQQQVEGRAQRLGLADHLQPDRALAGDCFGRIVGMDRKRAARLYVFVATLLSFRVVGPADYRLGAICLDLGNFRGSRDLRDEDARANAKFLCRESDRCAMVAAGRCRATYRRRRPG